MASSPRISFEEFVELFPGLLRRAAKEVTGTEPAEEVFDEFKLTFAVYCIPPEHDKIAKSLIMKEDVDLEDLTRSITKQTRQTPALIQGFMVQPPITPQKVLRTFTEVLIRNIGQRYMQLGSDLLEIATFLATLEKITHKEQQFYRITPDQKLEIKKKLALSLIDIDAYLKKIEPPLSPDGQYV